MPMTTLDALLRKFPIATAHGAVFAAGGAADIVLARCLAERMIALGAQEMDIVQPLNAPSLRDKGITGDRLAEFALEPIHETNPDLVLRHRGTRANPDAPSSQRGKGIRISTALQWPHGERIVCAGSGRGMALVAERPWSPAHPYDIALGVDGGGDVLTHDDSEFDRVTLASFASGWRGSSGTLGLVVMGLGADGGSTPQQLGRALPPHGWEHAVVAALDDALADAMQRGLIETNCWHSNPREWSPDDPAWDYGLKVPQIISMAIRREFPFPCPDPAMVTFPRRRRLTLMAPDLLCQARLYLPSAE